MFQLIAFIIFIISVLAISFIVRKKIPLLVLLPKNGHHGFKKPAAIASLEEKIRARYFHFFEKQMLLHKLLSIVRVLTLKVERKIGDLLQGIRQKAQELDNKNKK